MVLQAYEKHLYEKSLLISFREYMLISMSCLRRETTEKYLILFKKIDGIVLEKKSRLFSQN
jgi:hypothetical protein